MTEQNEMPDVIYAHPYDPDSNLIYELIPYKSTKPYIAKEIIGAGIDRGELDAELDYYDLFKETQMYKAASHLLELMDKGE
tara:strand:- start:1185 stop:1427 length:243 start_codon:yes stop_codon:yes gene_type:complete